MAATVSPDLAAEVVELRKRIAQIESVRASVTAPTAPPPTNPNTKIPAWLGIVNIGTILTLIFAIAGFAYYLGGLNTTVATTALRLERLEATISGPSKDSIASRLSGLENRMSVIEARVGFIEEKVISMDRKLDQLIATRR